MATNGTSLRISRILDLEKLKSKLRTFIANGPVNLFPTFPLGIFITTISVSFALTIFLSPVAAYLDKAHITQNWSAHAKDFLGLTCRSIYSDPLILHIIVLAFASWLAYSIARASKKNFVDTVVFTLIPLILLFTSHLLTSYVFKPSFDYNRPLSYSFMNEPPLVRYYDGIFGAGQSLPSGFVVRQMVLVLTVINLGRHSSSPLRRRGWRWVVNIIAILSVMVVGLLRIGVGSHTLFDVVFAVGTGAIIFWLLYVVPYALNHENGAVKIVCAVFLAFIGLFIFYSHNIKYWLISSFLIVGALLLIERFSVWLCSKGRSVKHIFS